MKKIRYLILICIALTLSFSRSPDTGQWHPGIGEKIYAQSGQDLSSSRKAIRLYEKGYEHYKLREYAVALEYLTKALEADPGFAEVYGVLGDIAAEQGDLAEAIVQYDKAVDLKPVID